VLLVHGYMGSPEQMRPLSEYLAGQGITTYNTRLAGHGTSPEDLSARDLRDWYYSIRFGYTILSGLVDSVIVCGYGLGGALGLYLTACGAPKISGVIMISTPTYVQGPRFTSVPFFDAISHFIDQIGISKNPVRFFKAHLREPSIGYSLNPVHGMYQYRRLIKETLKQARNVRTPFVIIQGREDPDVDDMCADEYYRAVSSPIKSIVRIDDAYLALVSRKDDRLFEDITAFIKNPDKYTAAPKNGTRKRNT
jgi:esterase/lipase